MSRGSEQKIGYGVPDNVFWTITNEFLSPDDLSDCNASIMVKTQRRPYPVYRHFSSTVLNFIRDQTTEWHRKLWALVMYFGKSYEELEGMTIDELLDEYDRCCLNDGSYSVLPGIVRKEFVD